MSMNFQGDALILVDGKETPFRSKVTVLVDGALQIRLEERESKARWQTKQLKMDEFVTSTNTVVQLQTIIHYATQFAVLLGSTDATGKAISEDATNGTRTLELRLAHDALSFASTLVHHFELSPVEVEKIDVLSAQMRDLKEAMALHQTALNNVQVALTALTNRVTAFEAGFQ